MAVPTTNGTVGSGTDCAAVTSITFGHTVNTGLSNPALFVGGSTNTTATLSATYAGTAMTLVKDALPGLVAEMISVFSLANPATGLNNVVVSSTAAGRMGGMAVTYTGVDQTTPSDANAKSNNTAAASETTSVTTATANSAVLDWVGTNGTDSTHTVPAGQTQIGTQIRCTLNFTLTMSEFTNGVATPGATAMKRNFSPNIASDVVVIAIKGVVTSSARRMLMGMGV